MISLANLLALIGIGVCQYILPRFTFKWTGIFIPIGFLVLVIKQLLSYGVTSAMDIFFPIIGVGVLLLIWAQALEHRTH